MLRTAIWMGMTTVGTALLASTTFGFTLPAAFLLSAAISAVLANIDNMPDHGRRGYHYMRPVFSPWSFGPFGGGPSIRPLHPARLYRGQPHTVFDAPPPLPVPLHTQFRPANPPPAGRPAPQAFNHFVSAQPLPSAAPASTRFNPAAQPVDAARGTPLFTSFKATATASPAFSPAATATASAPPRSAPPGVAPISSTFRPADTNKHNGQTPLRSVFRPAGT